jgi:hypothetical protein
MKIIGLRVEKYIDKGVSGHNCDFEYHDKEFEKHIICAVLQDNRKVEIVLSYSEGECGSGWTTASWGHCSVVEVDKFRGYNFTPISSIYTEDLIPGEYYDLNNNVFSISNDGGDSYYPSGSYNVNMKYFKVSERIKNKRPVWIFKGDSNAGKSFLASKISGLKVYETDTSSVLKQNITESIIVLGNKHPHRIEDVIKSLFGNCEVHIVEFSLFSL